jgi:nucleotide-binding universal stress UspA family protein
MKTILVLTDLSKEAGYAAHYAMNIATKVEAKLHLYHPFTLKREKSLKYPWKLEEYLDVEKDRRSKLMALAEQLREHSRDTEFKPPIMVTCREDQNDFAQNVRELIREEDILMILISSDCEELIHSLSFNLHGSSRMGKTSCPVLFVPPSAIRRHASTPTLVTGGEIKRPVPLVS